MIRFVDLRGQEISGYRFAFWDTTIDKFLEFYGDQAWETKEEFLESFDLSGGSYSDTVSKTGVERFVRLMPDWTDAE